MKSEIVVRKNMTLTNEKVKNMCRLNYEDNDFLFTTQYGRCVIIDKSKGIINIEGDDDNNIQEYKEYLQNILEKRKDKILNGPELCKYRLIKDTNYFSGENLRFVVFNPDLADYYADFIFNDKNGSMIALRTKLPFTPTTHDNQMIYMDTKLVLSDIFNVTNLDELLCGKTVAYPLEYIAFKYHKKYCNYDKEKLHEMVKAYGATFDVSKAERIDNFKKGKVKALQ